MAASLARTCRQISLLKQIVKNVFRKDGLTKCNSKVISLGGIQSRCYRTSCMYSKKRKAVAEKEDDQSFTVPQKVSLPVVKVWRNMTVKELAIATTRSVADVLRALNYTSDVKYANEKSIIANSYALKDAITRFGASYMFVKNPNIQVDIDEPDYDAVKRPLPDPSVLIKRHPVVTVMGHVDHGKTTLLDTLRHTSVVDTEFGGITQHIGAFNVTLNTGEKMTFLDTPGHAAFSTMRARGASVTDIVVLVVAADDGVMEQTEQSIKMAEAAKVPIVVAINKIDLPAANVERTQQMLAQKGILVEDLGGDVLSVNVSALKNINLDILMETVVMQAELLNLKGDPTGLVEAVIIEATNDIHRGKLATVLIQRGTLYKGAVLVSGTAWAKVRGMFDHSGAPVTEARLSDAVQVIGWKELPIAGEQVLEVENEKRAHMVMRIRKAKESMVKAKEHHEVASKRSEEYLAEYKEYQRKKSRATSRYRRMTYIPASLQPKTSNIPKVNVIIKGDVVGSVEAILDVLETYGEDDKCCLSVVHYGVGNVTETDLELAEAFNCIIYPFNVAVPRSLLDVIKKKNLHIRPCNVIYKLIDDLKNEIRNKLPQTSVEQILGEATVLQEFEITDKKRTEVKVAGCRCTTGILKKSATYRLVRNGETIFTGKLASMRHLKDEVNTIKTNVECGLRFEDTTVSFKPGDTLICFVTKFETAKLHWDPGF